MRCLIAIIITLTFLCTGAAARAQSDCDSGWGTGEILGTVGGAVLGGLIGSQIGRGTGQAIATGAGVVIGGFVGNRIGHSLDCADKRRANQNLNTSLEKTPTGETAAWRNPDSDAGGSTTPNRTWVNERGEPCREFTTTVTHRGQTESVDGVACRRDGKWVSVEG